MKSVIIVSRRFNSIPLVTYLETRGGWEVSASEDVDPLFTFSLSPVRGGRDENGVGTSSLDPVKVDVFEIRDALFSIKQKEQALAFFQAYGPWHIEERSSTETVAIRLSGLLWQQDFYRDALVNRKTVSDPPAVVDGSIGYEAMNDALEDFYFWQPLPMKMVFHQPPSLVVVCKDIVQALRASVFLDRVEGFSWRRCAREDCGKVFRLDSKHAKLYCDSECAHLQASRDYNERKRMRR